MHGRVAVRRGLDFDIRWGLPCASAAFPLLKNVVIYMELRAAGLILITAGACRLRALYLVAFIDAAVR